MGPVALTIPGVDCIPGVIGSASPKRLNPPLINYPPITLVGAIIGGGVIEGVIAEIAGIEATDIAGATVGTEGAITVVMGDLVN